MYREDWDCDVDVLVVVVDVVERPIPPIKISPTPSTAISKNPQEMASPLKVLTRVAQHLELTRLVAEAIHSQGPHHLIHRLAGRLVLVEQVAGEEDHVHVALLRETHDLVEALPAIVAPDGVAFVVSYMVVCRDEDADRVRCCEAWHCADEAVVGEKQESYLGEIT